MARIYTSPFFNLLQQGRQQGMLPGKEKEAREWYRQEAKKISVPTDVNQLLRPQKRFKKSEVTPGKMYMYQYDALTKDKLPYWDMFPLVFPYHVEADRFHGLNLHYLDRRMRARLMDALYTLTVSNKYDSKQRILMSYNTLKGVAKFKWFEPTVHTYLFSQLKSPLYEIPSQYWDTALFLPTERFQKASKTKVWKDSAAKVRKNWGKR